LDYFKIKSKCSHYGRMPTGGYLRIEGPNDQSRGETGNDFGSSNTLMRQKFSRLCLSQYKQSVVVKACHSNYVERINKMIASHSGHSMNARPT
jgi:hypothetical protein